MKLTKDIQIFSSYFWRYKRMEALQFWRKGESTRLPPMRPGFESWRRRHMWAEFVVCCCFSLLPRDWFLSRVLRFSPLLKSQQFQIPIRSGTHGQILTSSHQLLSAPWVNKLQFTFLF